MSKQNNLTDFLTGVADAIRAKKGTTALINPQNFESEIASIDTQKPTQEKTVDLAMASGNQVVTPDSGKTLSKVVVKKPATMLPENIKKDVNIGGVTGTLESGGGELNIAYGNTAPEDTSKLWIKSEEPNNISFPILWNPEQIVEGITDTGTTLPRVANGIGTAAVGTKIYLFGGYSNNYTCLNTIQVFDTTNNTIQTLSTTLPQAMYGMGTVAVGTKIYLFGGYSKSYMNTINLFTVNIPLSSNDIIVTQEYSARTFKVMKAPTEVEVAVKYVYKGDQNLAKLIDAYLYDGANWVNVNTGATA